MSIHHTKTSFSHHRNEARLAGNESKRRVKTLLAIEEHAEQQEAVHHNLLDDEKEPASDLDVHEKANEMVHLIQKKLTRNISTVRARINVLCSLRIANALFFGKLRHKCDNRCQGGEVHAAQFKPQPGEDNHFSEVSSALRQTNNDWSRRCHECDAHTKTFSVTGIVGCDEEQPLNVTWCSRVIRQQLPDGTRRSVSAGELAITFAVATGSEKASKDEFDTGGLDAPGSSLHDEVLLENTRLQKENNELHYEVMQLKENLKRWENGHCHHSGGKRRTKKRR